MSRRPSGRYFLITTPLPTYVCVYVHVYVHVHNRLCLLLITESDIFFAYSGIQAGNFTDLGKENQGKCHTLATELPGNKWYLYYANIKISWKPVTESDRPGQNWLGDRDQ